MIQVRGTKCDDVTALNRAPAVEIDSMGCLLGVLLCLASLTIVVRTYSVISAYSRPS